MLFTIIKIIIIIIVLDFLFSIFKGIREAESRMWRENRVTSKYAEEAYKNSKAYWKEVEKLQKKRKYDLISQAEFMELRRELDKKYEQQEYAEESTKKMFEEINNISKDYNW